MNAGLIFFIITLLSSLVCLTIAITKAVKLVKIPHNNIVWKSEIRNQIIFVSLFAILFMGMSISLYYWHNINAIPLDMFEGILGGLLFPLSFGAGLICFIIHYYRKKIPEKLDKWLYRIMIIGIVCTLVFLFVWSNGYADYISYPLPNGFWFNVGLTYPGPYEGQHIAFYAFFILGGAVLVYFLCDHRYYQEYGKHGILESLFLVAFPAGIIGARAGYCIGNWEKDFAGKDWWAVFDLRTGGLTIIAGALVGIIVGVLWFLWRKKQYNIWLAVDIIVPSILIAQAVGRWGNFFNVEVHGLPVNEEYFSWLPKIIFNNLHYSSAHYMGGSLTPLVGQVYVPLFLIESMTNMIGYFVLAFVFGKLLRNYTELGDLAFGYLIWYGLTRVAMEPLRDTSFNMGNDGYWSWFWSIIFVVVGVLLICLNHIIRYAIRVKNNTQKYSVNYKKSSLIWLTSIVLFSVSMIVIGSVFMSTSPVTQTLAFTKYTDGLIILFMGIALVLSISIPITYLIGESKHDKFCQEKEI